jgi:hypothetical protein
MKTIKQKYQTSLPLKVFYCGWNRSHGFFGNLAMFFLELKCCPSPYIFCTASNRLSDKVTKQD